MIIGQTVCFLALVGLEFRESRAVGKRLTDPVTDDPSGSANVTCDEYQSYARSLMAL